jgi:hypothetical protein
MRMNLDATINLANLSRLYAKLVIKPSTYASGADIHKLDSPPQQSPLEEFGVQCV